MSHGEKDIPPAILRGLKNYERDHTPVGGFLRAVLCNDLMETMHRGDERSLEALRAIVEYVYWELPSDCWGDYDRYKKWIGLIQKSGGKMTKTYE